MFQELLQTCDVFLVLGAEDHLLLLDLGHLGNQVLEDEELA